VERWLVWVAVGVVEKAQRGGQGRSPLDDACNGGVRPWPLLGVCAGLAVADVDKICLVAHLVGAPAVDLAVLLWPLL